MSRFLIATVPATGHINPALPIARRLIERGHEVRWYTGDEYKHKVEATGAHFTPMHADADMRTLEERFPHARELTGLAAFKFGLKHIFIDPIPGHIHDLQRILQTFPADVLLADTGFLAAGVLHELGGPRWATYGITALTLSSRDTAPFGMALPPAQSLVQRLRFRLLNALMDHVLFRDVQLHMRQVRRRLGLSDGGPSVLNSTLSPYLYLQSSTPAFEYPRSDLPPQVHFVGPLLPPPGDWLPPAWWDDMNQARMVVHVTQGTVATEAGDLLVPTLKALADEDVLVVATTGGLPVKSIGLQPLPANARVESFLPHGHLLPHVDLMITNGGYNGVQIALAHGVPLIVAGTSEEKPEIAARVAWSGAGINLKTKNPTPEQIRAAVREIRLNQQYRFHAERIKTDYARRHAPLEAVALLEQLATTGQPVLRSKEQTNQRANERMQVEATR